MKRRQFIGLVGGAAAWPVVARAQQGPRPVIGFIQPGGGDGSWSNYFARMFVAFDQGLKENGFIENENVAIEFHWAEGHNDRLPKLAEDLVRRQVAVILAAGGPAAVRAAMAATATTPIVFISASDPVATGLVASLSRPGGNVTGVAMINSSLDAKRLGLVHELLPAASTLAVVINPDYALARSQAQDVREAAAILNLKSIVVGARSEDEFGAAFASLVQQGASAALIAQDPLFASQATKLAALAARYAIPVMYAQRDYVTAGGLISYGPDFADGFRQAGIYVGKILKGAKPTELPVIQPTKFEMVINLKTAKQLGIEVSAMLLARADEVIE